MSTYYLLGIVLHAGERDKVFAHILLFSICLDQGDAPEGGCFFGRVDVWCKATVNSG